MYPHTFNPKYRGTSGPIDTSTPHHVHTIDLLFQQSFANKGLNVVTDPYGGDVSFLRFDPFAVLANIVCYQITGTWLASATMHPKTWTRSYAATAHYVPNKDRPNFTVSYLSFDTPLVN